VATKFDEVFSGHELRQASTGPTFRDGPRNVGPTQTPDAAGSPRRLHRMQKLFI